MPLTDVIPGGGDDKMLATLNGVQLFMAGPSYIQYGSTTITNTASETSMLTNTPGTTTAWYGRDIPADASSLIFPGNGLASIGGGTGLTVGTWYQARLIGTMANTGTPTLNIKAVTVPTVNAAVSGAISSATGAVTLATTGAVATSAITGSMDFEVIADFIVLALTGSNNIGVRLRFDYNTVQANRINWVVPFGTATVDLTQNQTFGISATWGAASASNTLITKAVIGYYWG